MKLGNWFFAGREPIYEAVWNGGGTVEHNGAYTEFYLWLMLGWRQRLSFSISGSADGGTVRVRAWRASIGLTLSRSMWREFRIQQGLHGWCRWVGFT